MVGNDRAVKKNHRIRSVRIACALLIMSTFPLFATADQALSTEPEVNVVNGIFFSLSYRQVRTDSKIH